ncbi:hypothetical protein HanIR_Chr11g0550751 [Helianthus annuus]|nr:hypothetical protein HanIR_Chr11g0550751 [Helianthus annuus]
MIRRPEMVIPRRPEMVMIHCGEWLFVAVIGVERWSIKTNEGRDRSGEVAGFTEMVKMTRTR